MHTLGRHLIAELYACDRERLDDVDAVRAALERACRDIGATALHVGAHHYAPQGVTATIIIAESHLSIHTWPEHAYAAVDFFTCGGLDPRAGVEGLARALGASQVRVQELARGLDDHVAAGAAVLPDDVLVLSSLAPARLVEGG